MSVGLVVVSHSRRLAEGVRELAAQMAADVRIVPAGGSDDGGIGTSFDAVLAAVHSADTDDGVVVLADLGSAVLTAESVLEFLDDETRSRVRVPAAPLVEGAVAAAVAAQSGADVDRVAAQAAAAGTAPADDSREAGAGEAPPPADEAADEAPVTGSFPVTNGAGLHARPAAMLARALGELDAQVRINGVDATSVMLLMTVPAQRGDTLTVEATGPDARAAVRTVGELTARGFDER